MDRAYSRLEAAQAILLAITKVETLWGLPSLGLALTYAYYKDERPRSANELAELADVSDDTARRHLRMLHRIGRVRCEKVSRAQFYLSTEAMAHKTIVAFQIIPGLVK